MARNCGRTDRCKTFLVRVIVEGAPSIKVDLTIDNQLVGELEGTSGGQLAVAMTAVRALPDVLASPPGVVTAPVFGAYRWPARPCRDVRRRSSR